MPLTVITGPPCAGKTTHITEHAQPGDIIIDLDRIALALSSDGTRHHHYPHAIRTIAIKARATAITEALAYTDDHHVWIIHSKPPWRDKQRYRAHGATYIALDPGYATCMRRAQGQRPAAIKQLIAEWYGKA